MLGLIESKKKNELKLHKMWIYFLLRAGRILQFYGRKPLQGKLVECGSM